MATSYRNHYQSQLEAGQRFQDFVAEKLYQEGIVIVGFQSREYQYDRGENLFGLEIKFDDQLAKTGNFWIEVSEKTDPTNPTYVPSGIKRGDAWLYGIGNRDEFWIFATRTLQLYELERGPQIRENGTKTSRGFLLSRQVASPMAARQFDWRNDPPITLKSSPVAPKSSPVAVAIREPGEDG